MAAVKKMEAFRESMTLIGREVSIT
ncbi:uncharacterized protein G2W53_010195 [Senna tora]|uniref:Uncharacterized protein n=1 Tax=Senna tora TaxID=362788 RepID=A0A835CB31_9FABA|nr:uncharacterized protein G2W53_010195 [Senna tora]